MDEVKLDRIFDSGWNPTKTDRVSLALDYLSNFEPGESLAVLIRLNKKYEEQLHFQTKSISGSGSQQDFIEAYIIAYEACSEVIDELQAKCNEQ